MFPVQLVPFQLLMNKIAILLTLILIGVSFFTGFIISKNIIKNTNSIFAKSDVPRVRLFITSLCSQTSQLVKTIRPITQLLNSKIAIEPHYLFIKISKLSDYCKPDDKNCLNENSYIRSSDGSYYTSLLGRQEANQNVREICAINLTNNITVWWDFVTSINLNCNRKNVDNCWENEAKKLGIDSNKITECFNTRAIDLIESEVSIANSLNVSTSPSILVNDQNLSKLTLTPNILKKNICDSFRWPPTICRTVLPDTTDTRLNPVVCGN